MWYLSKLPISKIKYRSDFDIVLMLYITIGGNNRPATRKIRQYYLEIVNFFDRRSTNAASESFNAKIKEFRTQFRGVKDRAFFLFRLTNIYA